MLVVFAGGSVALLHLSVSMRSRRDCESGKSLNAWNSATTDSLCVGNVGLRAACYAGDAALISGMDRTVSHPIDLRSRFYRENSNEDSSRLHDFPILVYWSRLEDPSARPAAGGAAQ
jgi:hypothetical protein